MHWLTTFLAVAGLFAPILPALPVVAAGTAGKADDLEHEVQKLLGDLAGPTRAERDAAEKQLVQLGPKVLPFLPAPELLPSVSVREAVRRVRVELERTAARDSVLPSHVTLVGKQSLAEALVEITRQTGNRLDGAALGDERLQQPVPAIAETVPFWKALDDLAARHQWRYEYIASGRGLKLFPLEAGSQPAQDAVSYAGAFRVAALPAERIARKQGRARDKKDGEKTEPADDLLRMTLLVMPEPRLRPLFLQVATKEMIARAADKTFLKAFSPEANLELALGEGTGTSQVRLDYLIPRTQASAVLSLKGRLNCTTAAGNERIRFTEIEKAGAGGGVNIARRRGGVTVTLQRVRLTEAPAGKQEARIQIAVTYDTGGPAFESHRSWILHNEVYLEDADGNQVRLNGGSDTTTQGDGSLGIEYRFVDLPDSITKYAFVYVAPTLIVDVPIDFEIQSVPIGMN